MGHAGVRLDRFDNLGSHTHGIKILGGLFGFRILNQDQANGLIRTLDHFLDSFEMFPGDRQRSCKAREIGALADA